MNQKRWTAAAIGDQSGRVAIVTGANSGIGLETARELAARSATVVLACRNPKKAKAAAEDIRSTTDGSRVEVRTLDVSDLASVRAFAESFLADHERLDLLINNAGVMMPPERSETPDGFELQMGTNHFGHFALTGLLLPLLLKTPKSRIVNVSSTAHKFGSMSFDDMDWKGRRFNKMASYGQSKLANLLFTLELDRRLRDAGSDTLVAAAHPGWTATNLQQHAGWVRALNPLFAMSPPQGALPTLYAAVGPDVQGNDYYGPDGFMEMKGYPTKVGRTSAARDAAAAARLFEVSEERTGVRFSKSGGASEAA